ncbi:hypothetical protein [Martelella alba]|uniref:hypothetical protein n=1 Tax=Martelella alba TaxID=2590451 RepID=UPI0015E869E8|nr:hypothetical protein [Martelella alba]
MTSTKTCYAGNWNDVQTLPEKPALWSRVTGVCLKAVAVVSMIVLATTVQLELSIRIEAQGDLAKVESSAEVSRDAAMPCAVDSHQSTVGIV